MSDTVKRGPGRPAVKSGLLEEPYELSILPMPRGWDLAIKLPRVPIGAFVWIQETPMFPHDMMVLFPRCTWEIGYDTALPGGIIMITVHMGQYAARELFENREASYDQLTDMLKEYVAKHGSELSAIAKKIRLFVGAE